MTGWSVTVVVIAAVVLAPLLYIASQLLGPASDAWSHVAETLLPRYAADTARLVLYTSAWALLFGVVPAWLVSAFRFPGRGALSWLLATPLAVPSYIAAFAWSGLLDFSGPVQTWLRHGYGPEAAQKVPEITNLPGVAFVLGSVLFPYVYVTTRAALRLQSGTHIEAARALGASSWRLFFRVVIPAVRPAIVAGLALVIMETLNDYGAVHLYGVDTFTTGIFRAFYALGDRDAAVRLAGVLLFGALVLLVIERIVRGRKRFDSVGTTRPLRLRKLPAAHGVLALVGCSLPVLCGLIIPVGMLLWWAGFTWSKVVGAEFFSLAMRSGFLAFGGACAVVSFALLLAYAPRIRSRPWVRAVVNAAGSGYAVPGAVIAVGVTALAAIIDDAAFERGWLAQGGVFLGGTAIALVWAYSVRFLAVGLHPLDAAFTRQGSSLDEASRSLGVSPSMTLVRVHVPVLRGAVAGAATLAFVDIMKELPLTLILRPFDFDTLATHTYQLASEEQVPESAPSALILVALGLVAVWVANRSLSGERKP